MLKDSGNNPSVAKCVYVAPTKVSRHPLERIVSHTSCFQALCSEKFNDWTKKFSGLGIMCMSFEHLNIYSPLLLIDSKGCELTGDTVVFGRSPWGDAKRSCIM